MRFLAMALLIACSTQEISEPDASQAADAEPAPVCEGDEVDRCESLQAFPPACYMDECGCGERSCGNERVCQDWGSGAVQCKTVFWCECSI